VSCFDGRTRKAKLRGKFKKRLWIKDDDFVLVSLWEFTKNESPQCDLVHKYYPWEVEKLQKMGQIPSLIEESNNYVVFERTENKKEEDEERIKNGYLREMPPSDSEDEDDDEDYESTQDEDDNKSDDEDGTD